MLLLLILMDHNMVFSYDYVMQKRQRQKNKCTSITGHFDGHVRALEQYRWHCPMRHVQGYPGSHWTPSPGNYLLHIAPAAARAIANKTTMKKWTNLVAILMAAAVRRYNTVRIPRWRRSRALVEPVGRCHWASIAASSCN